MFYQKGSEPRAISTPDEDDQEFTSTVGAIQISDEEDDDQIAELGSNLRRIVVENEALKVLVQHPIISAVQNFREELQRFVMLKEDRQDPPRFGLKETAPCIRDLRAATDTICSRLESLSFGKASAGLAVEERMLAKQISDQVLIFHSYLTDGIERRDHAVVQNAVKIKSFVSDVLLQFEATAQAELQSDQEAA